MEPEWRESGFANGSEIGGAGEDPPALDEERKQKSIIEHMMSGSECDFIALVDLGDGSLEFRNISAKASIKPDRTSCDYDECRMLNIGKHVVADEREHLACSTELKVVITQLEHTDVYPCAFSISDRWGGIRRKLVRFSYLGGDRTALIVTCLDITDAYLQEQDNVRRLQGALLAAERAIEAKSSFLSNVSHDMRTPLNGIIGYTELARAADDLATVHDYVEKIRISSNLLLDLINDTLTLSKADSGKLLIECAPIDNGELLSNIVVPMQAVAEGKGVGFIVDDTKMKRCIVMADRGNVQKVFLNLLSNAVKFTPAGGMVKIDVETLVEPVNGCNTRIVVQDSGIGISKPFLPHIYEPFSQEHTDNVTGTGLGLAIVFQLVGLMGGTIDVESSQGVGTRFTVLLDFPEVRGRGEASGPIEVTAIDADLSGTKVLLAEDNDMNTEIAVTLMEKRGMEVTCARNGQEAFDAFMGSAVGHFDIILMDLRMPVVDGFGATKMIRAAIREDAATVPIVAMSADAYDDDVRRCIEVGMNDHIAKPIDPRRLFRTIAGFGRHSTE